MNTDYLINQLKMISPKQYTLTAAVFMAIRARLEFKAGLANRIGRVFPNGSRHVLLVGKAGTGKTRLLRKIYDKLGLGGTNNYGRQVGKWVASAGASTGVGIYETLEVYNDSIIFVDEMSMDSRQHLHILKQIGNGEIMRPRHENIDPVPFTGLVVAATNAINVPKGQSNALEHLLAVLDRFMVVKVKGKIADPSESLDAILDEDNEPDCDWKSIGRALTRKASYDLSESEKRLLKVIWSDKSDEVIDLTRAQFRNSWTALDIFLFVKRFLGIEDLTKDQSAIQFVKDMIDDCIIFNPISVLWLNPMEEMIYDKIASMKVCPVQEIILTCEKSGQFINRKQIQKIIHKMIENRVICRVTRGHYATKVVRYDGSENKENVADAELINSL